MRWKPHPKTLSSAHEVTVHPTQEMPEQSKTALAASLTSPQSQPQPSRGNVFQQGSSAAPAPSDHTPALGLSRPSWGENSSWQPLQWSVAAVSTTFQCLRLLPHPARQQVFVMQPCCWKQADNSQLLKLFRAVIFRWNSSQKLLQTAGEIPTAFKFVKAS